MINAVWFMGGVIACIVFLLILVVIMDIAEEVSHKRLERIIEEYETKLDDQKTECEERLAQQRKDLQEHTRKCLAEQKEQIEEVGRKAREYQSARFEEERVRLANENFDSGFNTGKKEVMEKVKAMVKSGDITINRKGE